MPYDEDEIQKIISIWKKEGMEIVEGTTGMPVHPEFVYRKTGEWIGWNNFKQINKQNSIYLKNFERDLMESYAYKKMCH